MVGSGRRRSVEDCVVWLVGRVHLLLHLLLHLLPHLGFVVAQVEFTVTRPELGLQRRLCFTDI